MGQIGVLVAGLVMASSPAFGQTALYNRPSDDAAVFRDGASNANVPLTFAETNSERRLVETLPGAWNADRQALSAVQSARNLSNGEAEDGLMVYATSRRTIVSWNVGGSIDDASVSRMELTPGQASVGVAYRTGQAMVALAYVNREYSQRIGAQSVSQTESFAGVTLKLELGEK